MAGTEMLSFRRIGTVSTSPAASAAAGGAMITHHDGTAPVACVVQAATAHAARLPNATKEVRPAVDFARFHGSGLDVTCAPINVAKPSPAARIAHAVAAMSSRCGKHSTSARTASG